MSWNIVYEYILAHNWVDLSKYLSICDPKAKPMVVRNATETALINQKISMATALSILKGYISEDEAKKFEINYMQKYHVTV